MAHFGPVARIAAGGPPKPRHHVPADPEANSATAWFPGPFGARYVPTGGSQMLHWMMRPGEPGYSAQGEISRALHVLIDIREDLARAKSRADAGHSSRVTDIKNRQQAAVQAVVDADRLLQSQAAALRAGIDAAARDAAETLKRANLPSIRAQARKRSSGTRGSGDVNQTVREINAALSDLQNAVEEHGRVRMTLIARVRRTIGLPP